MAEKFSTGFRNKKLETASVKTNMANGVLGLYDGTQPADADTTEGTANLLALITVDGGAFTGGVATNGLNMGTATAGVLAKAAAETWEGDGLAAASTGTTATWFRWYDNSYTTGADTSTARVDGSIGTSSSYDLQLSNTTIVEDEPVRITTFNFTEPAS